MVFTFVQPDEIKYNLYIQTKHPEYEYLDAVYKISDDPLRLRHYINILTPIHFCIYIFFCDTIISFKMSKPGNFNNEYR